MKISRIDVFGFDYTIPGGTLTLSGGRTVSAEHATLVKISTDEGLVGWGEECPFSPTYMLAFAEGARAGIQLMGPALIGADPRQIEEVYARMDSVLYGHAYAKSPIDIACWDILGQATGLPVSDLLGGTVQPRFPLYNVVGVDRPEKMRAHAETLLQQGFRRFQVKVGSGHWQRGRQARSRVSRRPARPGGGDLSTPTPTGSSTRPPSSSPRSRTSRSTWSSPAAPSRSASRSAAARRGR